MAIATADDAAQFVENGWWGREGLSDVVARHAQERPDQPAYLWGSTRMSWAEYHRCGDQIAARLAGVGVRAEDRVLVFLPDGGAVHAAFLGCDRAGAVAVGVGWRAGRRELAKLCEKTKPIAALVPSKTPLDSAETLCRDLGIPNVVIVENLDRLPRPAEGPVATPSGSLGPSALWLINSTSGTTGLPKCVMQTQNRWFYFHQLAMKFGDLGPNEVWMSVVPAPFGFGLWTSHFSPTLCGAPCIVQPRFDARDAAERIARNRVTVLCAVSSQFVMILDAAGDLDLSSLRVLFTGGERLPLERSREFEERTGCSVLNFYGSNETGVLSGTRVTDPLERRISSGGRCVDEMQVRLYDDSGKRIPGDVGMGRPACRGPATSPGYYEDVEANRELFTEDGWMMMGDYVEIDGDGWLSVIGRSADFIVRGGKNLSAPAIEEEVCSHPNVLQAAAVAVPDDRLGEIVGICLQLREGSSMDLESLREHLRSRGVSKEWWPERVAIVPTFPTSSGGKIAKGALRDRVAELFPNGSD
jgi:acyl-CoA synthetase